MPVTTTHNEYQENASLWEKVRDCVKGEHAIKAGKEKYLPRPSGKSDKSYLGYIARARFSNFTGRTAEGLHGSMFSLESAQSEGLSQPFIDFLENVDNAGTSIEKFARELSWDVLQTGWGGILVDYSRLPEGQRIDVATADREGFTSYLKWYSAESVINWRYDTINDKTVLSLAVLMESFADGGDEFAPSIKTRYRVLRLTDGVYTQQVYIPNEATVSGEYVAESDPLIPMMNGQPLRFIPFYPCPAPEPEKSLLLDLAHENIGHYMKSADLENALHISAAPTGYGVTDRPPEDKKTGKPETVNLGGESFVWLPLGSSLAFLEPSGSGLSQMQSGMEASENRMKILGAEPFAPSRKGVEAAETARLHAAAGNSVLGAFAVNMGEIITNAARLGAQWRGVSEAEAEEWEFRLNTNYHGDFAEIEERKLALEQIDADVMSKHRYLIKFEGMTEEEADKEIRRLQEEGRIPLET